MNQVKTIDINLIWLLENCTKDKKNVEVIYDSICKCNRENLHKVFLYKLFLNDLSHYVSCYNTGNGIIGYIRPSYEEFLNRVKIDLGVSPKCSDNDDLTHKLLERVDDLSKIRTETDLRHKFPEIHKRLIKGRNYIYPIDRDIYDIKGELDFCDDKERVLLENKLKTYQDNELHYFYGCAMQRGIPRFIKTQTLMYTRFVTKRDELKDIQSHKTYNKIFYKYLDIDKMYMCIISEYLSKIETIKDKDEIRKYIQLIDKYLLSDRDLSVKIVGTDGSIIDIDNIKKRLENAKRRVSDNSSEVNWELIPSGHYYDKTFKREGRARTTIFNYEEIERLKGIGASKAKFYEESNYMGKAIGLKKYQGYIAYIYPNGRVILDREFNRDTPSTAMGDAIYVVDADKFLEASPLNKGDLREFPGVIKMNHSKSWMDRANSLINEKRPDKEESSKVLIKKLKEESK